MVKNHIHAFLRNPRTLLAATAAVRAFFPPRCPGCGRVMEMDREGFCESCMPQVERVPEPACMKCGSPIERGEGEYCPRCRQVNYVFRQNKAAFVYRGAVKDAMYDFKYKNRRSYGEVFARELVEAHRQWLLLRQPEVIVPIPMNRSKERERGYNQAMALAQYLEKWIRILCPSLDISVKPIVERSRSTVPLKGLSPHIRRKNLKKAFKIRKNVVNLYGMHSDRGKCPFRRVLLVDDIFTTGATLDAVSELLLEQGICVEVCCMTAAISRNLH